MLKQTVPAYAGIKLMDPASPVTYEDAVYDLLRQPTDPSRRFSLQDTFALQRNRFEHLPEFRPDDEAGKVKQGIMVQMTKRQMRLINTLLVMKTSLMPMFIRSIVAYHQLSVAQYGWAWLRQGIHRMFHSMVL